MMQRQRIDGVRVSRPLMVEEVEITTAHPSRHYVVRREPHPEIEGGFVTEVHRHDIKPGKGYGDIHTSRAVEWLDDDGRPLDLIAQAWALRHGIGAPGAG
jgi:hypothetical protein